MTIPSDLVQTSHHTSPYKYPPPATSGDLRNFWSTINLHKIKEYPGNVDSWRTSWWFIRFTWLYWKIKQLLSGENSCGGERVAIGSLKCMTGLTWYRVTILFNYIFCKSTITRHISKSRRPRGFLPLAILASLSFADGPGTWEGKDHGTAQLPGWNFQIWGRALIESPPG